MPAMRRLRGTERVMSHSRSAPTAFVTVTLSIAVMMLVTSRTHGQTRSGNASVGAAASARAAEVAAILANQCVSCHGPERKKGGLDLTGGRRRSKGARAGPPSCRVAR